MSTPIRHVPDQHRFEASVDGRPCRADYRLADGVMVLTHTEVAPEIEGRGIGGELIQAALDHAKTNGLKVRPQCAFARHYMQQHPESAALRA